MTRTGSMSLHTRYGEIRHHPVGPLGRPLSLWSMGLRLSSPWKSPWAPYMSRHMTKPRRTSSAREDIDLIDERRWQFASKNERYHQALKRYQEWFVRSRELQVDDLVLRWVLTREGANKLSSGWEGPFRVTQVCHPGCVCLATEDREPLHNPWNIEHFRKFYP
jgi:hypothetical protein